MTLVESAGMVSRRKKASRFSGPGGELIGHDIINFQDGRKSAADDGRDELFVVGIPKIDGRAPGPGDLAGAGDDDAQQVITIDLLGEGFAEIVEKIVDDFFLLLERDKFLLQLGLQPQAARHWPRI